jgi:hypothetical protein
VDVVQTIALTLGVGWAAGLNLYAAVFMLGLLGNTGNLELPAGLEICADPLVRGAAGLMYCVEFFADKVPGVDTTWDAVHTFIRIPAGAVLAAGAVGDLGAGAELAAALVGGGLAAGSHATKAGTRLLVNTSPEPFSNIGASLGEDVAVFVGLWTALHYPVVFLALLAAFVLFAIWLLPKIARAVAAMARRIRGWFQRGPAPPPDPASDI